MPQCGVTTKAGKPCRYNLPKGRTRCVWHDQSEKAAKLREHIRACALDGRKKYGSKIAQLEARVSALEARLNQQEAVA